LDYRVKALDEYNAIIKIDEDVERRRMMRMSVKQGVIAAESLKKRIRETTPNPGLTPPTTTNSVSPPSTIATDDLDMNNDKELSDAYQHCLNGNQLALVFQFARACEEYEIGLNVMLQAARAQTDPTKIKILRDMISHYLTKAESCKQRSETQRLDLAIEKIKEDTAGDTTIIENPMLDELINEDKKQQSPSQPSCRQQ